jgi:hypothetical protein
MGTPQPAAPDLPIPVRSDRRRVVRPVGWGLLLAVIAGGGLATPTGANTPPGSVDGSGADRPPFGGPQAENPQAEESQTENEPACNSISLETYIDQDSPPLQQSFCELLTFSPLSLSSLDSFFAQITPGSYTSDQDPSPKTMTLPSLWWSRDSLPRQFGSYRLVDAWAAYEISTSALRVIDVYINPQIWRILQYPERYGALSHFATEAREYQYNVRLFNNNGRSPQLIGLYVCDFPSDLPGEALPADLPGGCVALLDTEAIARLQNTLLPPDDPAQASTDFSDRPAEPGS